jgi:RNA polymerase sigma factor (sigma-70 family)
MKALATRLTGSASVAEDVFQEAALRVWRWKLGAGAADNLRAYFARAVTNLSFDTRRRRQNARATDAQKLALASSGHDGPAQGLPDGLEHHLRQAIRQLSPQQREAIVLRYFQGLDFDTMAGVLGCSPPTARSHVSKAVAALRKTLRSLPSFQRFCEGEDKP